MSIITSRRIVCGWGIVNKGIRYRSAAVNGRPSVQPLNQKKHMQNNFPTMPRQGFTLIELALIIVILSVLAIAALPRFIDLNTQATRSTVAGTAGSFQEAVILVRATLIANGLRGPRLDLSGFGDGTVDIGASGFPVDGGVAGGSTADPLTSTRCLNVWNSVLQNPPSITTSAAAYSTTVPQDYRGQYVTSATVNNRLCRYTYRPVASPVRRFDYYYNTGRVIITNP